MAIGFFIILLALLIYGLNYFESVSASNKIRNEVTATLDNTNTQNGTLVEVNGSISAIAAANPSSIMISTQSNTANLKTKLTLQPGQQNLVHLLNVGDQVSADCAPAEETKGPPSLANCLLKNILTPVYGQGTDSQLSLNKNYSSYNGQSFNTAFLMGVPATLMFNAKVNCHSKKMVFTDVFVLKKKGDGTTAMTNIANLDSRNTAQKKIIDADTQLKQMLQTLVNSKTTQNATLNSYINQVCALPAP